MARARSPDSIEAEKMYRSGMKLVDIAKKLGKPDSTVRRWKSEQKWEIPDKKKASVRKSGAPKGNKNAEGAGAPNGNKNAEKHGAYSSVYWDVLKPEELEMIEDIPTDEEVLLMEQIKFFAVRERRIMIAINKYMEVKGGQYISGVTSFEDKRKFKNQEEENLYNKAVEKKVKKSERLPGEKYSVQTNIGATVDLISRLERELTSVQAKKTKAIDSLARLRSERKKIEDAEQGDDFVNEWIEKIGGKEVDEGR